MDRSNRPQNPSSADQLWLEAAVEHLQSKADLRGVIRVVERWATTGEPSNRALLDQARAFLKLNLMDRAWVRLKEVCDREPDNLQAQLLTAQMFIERGWPMRARKLLERVGDDGPRAQALLELAQRPAMQPPKNAREIEAQGSRSQQLEVAERFIAAGSFLRAKGILERAKVGGGPVGVRAELLIWGLRGSFVNETGDPGELAAELAPELASFDEAGTLDDGYSSSEVTSAGLAAAETGGSDEGFPVLFRRESPISNSHITEEVTAVSHLASPGELLERALTEDTDHGGGGPLVSGDTQIMMVIRKDGQKDGANQDLHVLREEEDGLRETLNLRDYLTHMGMDPAHSDLEQDMVDLEEEDEDLIVVTRRELTPDPTEEAQVHAPVQVVERSLPPMRPPEQLQAMQPPTEPSLSAESDEEVDQGSAEGGVPAVIKWIFGLMIFGVLLLVLALGGVLLRQRMANNAIMEQALDVVASQDELRLHELEAALEARVRSGEQSASLSASYALVELVIWEEYSGDVSRLEEASASAQSAARARGAGRSVALVYAYKALAQGDLSTAQANLQVLDEQAESQHLRGLLAQEHGQMGQAQELAESAVEMAPMATRYHLRLSQVCQARGKMDCAMEQAKMADEMGDSSAAQLQLQRLQVASQPPAAQLQAAEGFLAQSGIPPRVASEAQSWRSHLLARLGQSEQASLAVEQGLQTDPDNPELLLSLAALQAAEGAHRQALASLERASSSRPLDLKVQGARLQILIELDRILQAETLLARLPASAERDSLQSILDLFGRSDPKHARELAQRRLKLGEDPLALYALGFAMGRLADPDAGEQLGLAYTALRASKDPFLLRLAPRALAAQALFLGDMELAAQVLDGPADPLAMVLIGQLYAEETPQQAGALFDRASEIGPDVALVHYARGQFYLKDPERRAHTRQSWGAYLALSPSGERAARVKEATAQR